MQKAKRGGVVALRDLVRTPADPTVHDELSARYVDGRQPFQPGELLNTELSELPRRFARIVPMAHDYFRRRNRFRSLNAAMRPTTAKTPKNAICA